MIYNGPGVVIIDDGDETCFVVSGGETIGTISHEDYGWVGMRDIMDLIKALGASQGFEVIIEQDIV